MARKPRIHYPDAFYHVMLRGNDGQNIFHATKDRFFLYDLIQEGIERFGHRIHAFCLMTNHLHLIVQVDDIPLAKIIQNMSFRYTRYFNKNTKRIGHLFQGRYKALLIDSDNYLLELVRYIHHNPIRAGAVRAADQYRWSSYRAYMGQEKIYWLTQDFVLSQFAKSEKKARHLFQEFCLEGVQERHRQEFHKGTHDGRILGDKSFVERMLLRTNERFGFPVDVKLLVKTVCEIYQINDEEIITPGKQQPYAEARAIVAYLAREMGNPSLTEVGRYLQRDITALSRSASRLRDRLHHDVALSEKLEKIKDELQRKSKCQA